MYCPACKLWFSENGTSVCPACGGLLQPEVDNSPHSSERKVPAGKDEAIRFLDDLWGDKDIDADLEGEFAEIFDLDDEVDKMEADVETEDELKPGKPEDLFVPSLVVTPNRNRYFLLLFSVLVVISVGSGVWLYQRNPGSKLVEDVGRPVSRQQQVYSASLPSAKKPVALQKSTIVKSEKDIVKPAEKPLKKTVMDDAKTKSGEKTVTAIKNGDRVQLPKDGKVISPVPVIEVEAPKNTGKPAPLPVAHAREKTAKIVKKSAGKTVAGKVKFPYVIQVGSFKTKAGLDRQLAKLRKKGFAAYPVRVDLGKKGIWQRVYISDGTSREKAKVMQEKLHKLLPREESRIVKIRP